MIPTAGDVALTELPRLVLEDNEEVVVFEAVLANRS